MKPISPHEFVTKAKRHFRFLIDEFGFVLHSEKIIEDACEVMWTSSRVFVSVSVLPPQFEVQMQFGRIGIDDQPNAFRFEPGDLVQLETCKNFVWRKGPDEADTYLAEFARLLQTCGRECLFGIESVYVAMKARRDAQVAEWINDERSRAVRDSAEAAWAKRDYSEAAKQYSELTSLTDVEQKRLSLARRYMQNGQP